MNDILIFGGASEGRLLAEFCSSQGIPAFVSVVSAYGERLISGLSGIRVTARAMDEAQMEEYIRRGGFGLVIDATHPYAEEATKNISRACEQTGTRLLRCRRETGSSQEEKEFFRFSSAQAAADFLTSVSGNIFLSTGSKELEPFAAKKELAGRLFVRVLPSREALFKCEAAGISGKQIICMQGPFTEEMNIALLRQTCAAYLVTKDTGVNGGFPEKQSAAKKCRIPLVIIERPEEKGGLPLDEVKQSALCFAVENGLIAADKTRAGMQQMPKQMNGMRQMQGMKGPRKMENPPSMQGEREDSWRPPVILAGIGPGAVSCMTGEVKNVIRESDVLLGSPRALQAARQIEGLDKKSRTEAACYLPDQVIGFLKSHRDCGQTAILFSGDTGFYSGAKKLCERLRGEEIPFLFMPGLSSVSYFAGRLGISWEDASLFTAHGREFDLRAALAKGSEKLFLLMGGEDGVGRLCRRLCDLGFQNARLCVGENLSYPEEQIVRGLASELLGRKFAPLCIVFLEFYEKLRDDNER